MADINHAYGHILENNTSNFRKITHFFTQRKITEIHDAVHPTTLKRTKKDINFVQNYMAIVLPKDEKSPRLRIEIYGNNGYCYQGEIISHTENTPHLLIPLNDDKEIFVNIFDFKKDNNKEIKQVKYMSFIHVPKRYQDIDDDNSSSTKMTDLKNNETKNHLKQGKSVLQVDLN